MTTVDHGRTADRSAVLSPRHAHRVALFGLVLLLLGLAALGGAASVAAAPGDLLKTSNWLPRGDFMKYATMELVRGPGGDLWLAATGGNSSSDTPYQKRICVARYSAAGARRWAKLMPTKVSTEYMRGVAVDAKRNAVIVGSGHWTGNRALWEIIKIGPSGNRVWTRFLTPPTDGWSIPRAIACDSAGSIYVAGTMTRAATGSDVALAKFSATGVRKWTRYLNGYDDSLDEGVDVAVDGSGRVYVTGTVGSFFSGKNILVARYSTTGKRVWRRDWDRGGSDDTAVDLAVSAAGVAVAGISADASGFSQGVALHATPAMPQNAEPVEHVTTVTGKSVTWNSVATNASGAVACGGVIGYSPSYFAYARYRPGAPDDLAWYTSPANTARCEDVWLGADSTLLAAGTWVDILSHEGAALQSDFVAAPDWLALPTQEGRVDRGWAVAASSSKAYVAGETGDALGLCTFER